MAGGTGIVGREVVGILSTSTAYKASLLLTRRDVPPPGPRVEVYPVDFEDLCAGGSLPKVDHVFICLGTTRRLAGSQDAFRRVDLDYVVAVTRAAREAGASRLAMVSSVGASTASRSFYLRVKGEAEEAVTGLGYDRVVIARPGLLRGPRDNDLRLGETAAKAFAPVMDALMFGSLRRYRSIYPAIVARALVAAVQESDPQTEVLHYPELIDRARGVG